VRAVEQKSQENRQFTNLSLSLHFPQISPSLLQETVADKLRFWKLFTLAAKDAYGRTQNETAGQCVNLSDAIQ
jgi:hypothetical protein